MLEEFEDNPFLPKFYEDRERYAFQTQLAFLASRFKQQQNMMTKDLFHELTISDYIFDKDRIFARLNLGEDELALYDTIFNIMSGIAAQPNLVVFIQSSVERLMHNIDQRGRVYEQHITPDYLRDLNNAYNHFFYHYNRTPVIFINTTEIDFVNNTDHLAYIEEHIRTPNSLEYTYTYSALVMLKLIFFIIVFYLFSRYIRRMFLTSSGKKKSI